MGYVARPRTSGRGRELLLYHATGGVLAALRDPEVFSSKTGYDEMISAVPLVPLGFDPPEHTRYRRILHPFFSPQTLGSVLPSLQAQAIDIIEADRTAR